MPSCQNLYFPLNFCQSNTTGNSILKLPHVFSLNGWTQSPPLGTSLLAQWWEFCLSMQGVWVRSLVRELRPHITQSQKKRTYTKNGKYCNKFNKGFKNGPHQKKKSSGKKESLSLKCSVCLKTKLYMKLY